MDKVAQSYSHPSLPCTPARSIFFRRILTNPKTKRAIANSRNTKLRAGFSLDFEQYMSANAKAVHEALDQALPVRQPERLSESMRYSVLSGGKRVRPVLTIAACELVGGSAAVATPVACAVEMVHKMSLIHDDMPCMDDSAVRRGRPANHIAFGEYTALLSGHALLALAFEHLARGCAELPAGRALRAVAELAECAGALATGQLADKESEGVPVSLAMLEYINQHRTGRLLEAAAVCGAIVGGGTDGEIESLRRYARSVGLLLQVVDDLVDIERDQAHDKATYPKVLGVEQAQAYAADLVVMAEGELEGFDEERAAPLYHLARLVAYMK